MTSIPPLSALQSADLMPQLPQTQDRQPAAEPTRARHAFEASLRSSAQASMRTARAKSVGEEFEAVALTSFVENMLPPDSSSVWGGQAGKLWRGVFAQHLASEVAATGGVGIADIVNTMLAEQQGDRS